MEISMDLNKYTVFMGWELDLKMLFLMFVCFLVETGKPKIEIQRIQNSQNNIEKKNKVGRFT